MDVMSNDSFIETLVFFHTIKSYESCARYKANYFSNETLKRLFEIIQPHVLQYKEEPTEEQVLMIMQREGMMKENSADVIHSLWEIRSQLSQYSQDWLEDASKSYAEWNNFVFSINRLSSYIMTIGNNVTVENCHEYVEKAKTMFTSDSNFSYDDSVGFDFFDPKTHISIKKPKISTGYPFMDACLGGGLQKGTLTVIAGTQKIGKSQFLLNIASNIVRNGYNVLYVSLEMGVDLVSRRIGCNLFNIKWNDYEKISSNEDEIRKCMKNFYNQCYKTPGALVINEFPTSTLTPQELDAFILNAENARSTEDKKFKFDVVCVDYINIMKSARYGANDENSYQKIKGISEDLRSGCQKNGYCLVSLTQNGRSAINCSMIRPDQVSESIGLWSTVDAGFSIIRTPGMAMAGYYYLTPMVLRNSEYANGDRKRYIFQGDYMRITEDESEGILREGMTYKEELLMGASDYQQQMQYQHKSYNNSRSNNNEISQKTNSNTPVQQPAPTKAPDLGATELKISGYDLFQ